MRDERVCVTRSAAASTFRAGRVFFLLAPFFLFPHVPPPAGPALPRQLPNAAHGREGVTLICHSPGWAGRAGRHAPRAARGAGGGRAHSRMPGRKNRTKQASEVRPKWAAWPRGRAARGRPAMQAHPPSTPLVGWAGAIGGRDRGVAAAAHGGALPPIFFFGGRAWPRPQCCRHPLARSPALTVVRASPDLQQLGPRPRRAERAGRHPRGRAKQVERQVAGPGGGDSRGAGRARREEIFGAHERRHKGRRRGAGHWEMRGVGWGVCTRAWNGRGARGKGPTPLWPGRPRATRPNPKAAGPAREQASGGAGEAR